MVQTNLADYGFDYIGQLYLCHINSEAEKPKFTFKQDKTNNQAK